MTGFSILYLVVLIECFPFQLFVYSAYQPKNSAVFPVYNPLPGSWFVAAYLEPFSETLGFKHKCKYSLGSIGEGEFINLR